MKTVTALIEAAGLDRSERLEKELSNNLGPAAKAILIPIVLTGRAGRCVVLFDRRHQFLSITWRGVIDGEELASLILSNSRHVFLS